MRTSRRRDRAEARNRGRIASAGLSTATLALTVLRHAALSGIPSKSGLMGGEPDAETIIRVATVWEGDANVRRWS